MPSRGREGKGREKTGAQRLRLAVGFGRMFLLFGGGVGTGRGTRFQQFGCGLGYGLFHGLAVMRIKVCGGLCHGLPVFCISLGAFWQKRRKADKKRQNMFPWVCYTVLR